MAKKVAKKSPRKAKLGFVTITRKGYGNKLRGKKIYFEGTRPKFLKEDGTFQMGKNLMDFLLAKYKTVRLVITRKKSRLEKRGKGTTIYLSPIDLRSMQNLAIERGRDVKMRVLAKKFSELFPKEFSEDTRLYNYEKGMFDGILTKDFLPSLLSTDDRKAMVKFIPRFVASGVAGKEANASGKIKSGLELEILKQIASDLEKRIASDKAEATWQDYVKGNILHIQQGYIAFVEKANISVIGTKFPDFLLVTHDEYLDILEIKTPVTQLLVEDRSRGNYYWAPELSKAISQAENYIHEVYTLADKVRNQIKGKYAIELRVVRPRGVILAGNTEQFANDKKMADDFRLLSQGLKNITVVTYDELLVRLQNYIAVLTELGNS